MQLPWWIILVFVIDKNNAAARCGVVPAPDEGYVSWPGRDLANAISSFTLRAGVDGCTTSSMPAVAVSVTGANARCASNGILAYKNGFTVRMPMVPISKVKPSGAAFATISPARLPPAPGRLSTTTGTPHASVSRMAKGPALTAVLGGESDLSVLSSSAVMPYVNAGRMRALAITSAKRMNMLPQIPTVAEGGVPGYDFASWVGLLVPASTPPAMINTVNAMVVKASRAPDLVDRYTKDATEVVANSPAEFKTFIQSEARRRT